MLVQDVMSRQVTVMSPTATVRQAAMIMRTENIGIIPIVDGGRVVGMVSDRDLAVRVLPDESVGRDTALSQVMTAGVHHVHADDDVAEAIETMARHQVHRVPVLDRATERPVGIVSLGDLGRKAPEAGREALEGISEMDPR